MIRPAQAESGRNRIRVNRSRDAYGRPANCRRTEARAFSMNAVNQLELEQRSAGNGKTREQAATPPDEGCEGQPRGKYLKMLCNKLEENYSVLGPVANPGTSSS